MSPATSIYSLTILTSAFLLFFIQPVISKMLLPYLGGAPAVWNTAMVFFQALLLLGYLYAYALSRFLPPRRQALVHLGLVTVCLLGLPVTLQVSTQADLHSPILWMMQTLLVTVGYPFFLLSANASLLQHWYATSQAKRGDQAYMLYAASNTGSLAALLSYPVLIEPLLGLDRQLGAWSLGYAAFGLLLTACAWIVFRQAPATSGQVEAVAPKPAPRQRLYWLMLAFIPSSLLLGVTTYITTDIASMPLFWVVPLAIYLLTFILAFLPRSLWLERALRAQVSLMPVIALMLAFQITFYTPLLILHLFAFFAAAMSCHGLLARSKPPVAHLTEFYLWISLGGVLGGIFNTLIAPQLFTLPWEYPLMLVLAVLARMSIRPRRREVLSDLLIGSVFFAGLFGVLAGWNWINDAYVASIAQANSWLGDHLPAPLLGQKPTLAQFAAVGFFLLCMAAAFNARERPLRLTLIVGAILLAVPLSGSGLASSTYRHTIYAERNFFGVNRVLFVPESNVHYLVHGTTLHGTQSQDPALKLQMLSYYHDIGVAYRHLQAAAGPRPIGLVGMGGGVLACLASAGQEMDMIDIDPAVIGIARNPSYFTFLSECPGKYQVILGDGRLEMARQPEGRYGFMVVDAFSSDAIPLHLLTREALQLYLSRLGEGGVLALHISNNHLDLRRQVAAAADALGLAALVNHNMAPTTPHAMPSTWVLLAREEKDFQQLPKAQPGWHTLIQQHPMTPWTDNYSNILGLLL